MAKVLMIDGKYHNDTITRMVPRVLGTFEKKSFQSNEKKGKRII